MQGIVFTPNEPEPKFSEASLKAIAKLRERYPTSHAALIPVLFIAQKEFGYLTKKRLELVAETLDVPAAKVAATATFYTMFHKAPIGRFHIQVCKNISCYLRGSDEITAAFEDAIKIATGETSEDGLFTISEVECLAACGRAPVIQINEDYHEWLTPEKARQLVQELEESVRKDA